MKKILNYCIAEKDQGKTIETFLKSKGYSHHVIVHLRQTTGGITVNGKPVYTTHVLSEGELLMISLIEENTSEHIVPVSLPLSIVYEDEDLMVINKAAKMPIHPSQGNFDNTLANGVAYYFKEKKEPFVYRAVNRLDRDTTGLLIIAKHMLSAAILSSMVAKKEVCREYLAITEGKADLNGIICQPIARADGSTIERCVDPVHGEYACTHYRRLLYDDSKDCSLVQLTLDTGRTHQIRVHMKYIGHPLLGDFLYNPDYRYIERQSLHSYRLRFTHPISGEAMEFTAPIPEDFDFLSHELIAEQGVQNSTAQLGSDVASQTFSKAASDLLA
ncbi:MAG: RluA family pseudouridine synthase [Clostridium sp.]